jgi:hypothetical protein
MLHIVKGVSYRSFLEVTNKRQHLETYWTSVSVERFRREGYDGFW